ncbi:MAG: acetyl-CoA carboxylase biotin carboxylase subunit [bacterium]
MDKIKKVLIANRGEIALRIIRTLKEMDIKTVAIYSEVDKDSLHVRFADESVCIGKDEVYNTYLNIPNIISAALVTGSDAIHPGYGFLSENYKFAEICRAHDITFIGPSSESIRDMGDKVKAKEIANKLNVPTVPSTPAIRDINEAKDFIKKYGLPVIIKAAGGGGGRGMRIIENINELENKFLQATNEAKNFFGNPEVYIEKLITNSKHIEVQIIGDKKRPYHLYERDCSVQRKQQKIIEEANSLIPENIRQSILNDALKIAEYINYYSTGTIEFLYDLDTNNYYFIEMNTRIQVEHPATEMITNTDIVKLQVLVANGYTLDEFNLDSIKLDGYAIEVRIYAEDSIKLAPSIGTITKSYFPNFTNVRVDTAVVNGYNITQFYDNMIAKLIVKGKDRNEAIKRLNIYLDQVIIEGVKTNIEFLKKIINDKDYIDYKYNTLTVDNMLKQVVKV